MYNWLIVVGVACLTVVILGNVAEYFDMFPEMGWSRSDSPGRVLTLTSELVGITAIVAWVISQRPR
jgi:hypothetical protein